MPALERVWAEDTKEGTAKLYTLERDIKLTRGSMGSVRRKIVFAVWKGLMDKMKSSDPS